MKKYKVTLSDEERQLLHDLIAAGKAAARKLTHARILLKADASQGSLHWPDWRIADALEVHSPPSSEFASDSLSRASRPPWSASEETNRLGPSSSMVAPRLA